MTGAGRRLVSASASAFVFAMVLAAASGSAQEATPVPAAAPDKASWEFTANLWGYFPPDDRHYAQPTVTADRGALHLEARYNYEGFKTGSAWIGWNFEAGEKVKLEATLLAGGIFGNTHGAAPGYLMTLSSGRFELYSEGEYVFDTDDSDDNFFYNWAQLGYSATDWLKVGLASQRTRAYHTGLAVQRGVFAGFTWNKLSLNVFVFNLGWETPTVVSSISLAF